MGSDELKKNACPSSMTGYARESLVAGGGDLAVEIKSLNHRSLDIVIKLPRGFTELEWDLRKQLSACFTRGRIELSVSFNEAAGAVTAMDETRIDQLSAQIRASMHRQGVRLTDTHSAQAVFEGFRLAINQNSAPTVIAPELKKSTQALVSRVCDQLLQSRLTEGRSLVTELEGRAKAMVSLVKQIEHLRPKALQSAKERLQARARDLLGTVVDPQRLEQEFALLVERGDFAEELSRLLLHIEQFEVTLRNPPCGRKLDFLSQELMREASTLGSKSADAQLQSLAVELKLEIDRAREQVQNIE